ncbi:MAG: glycosyltransferase family 2 protein [Candidatus Omnitrophota bacterium]
MHEKLSVVIITKNEEEKIARCLESVKWANEVVVVDGYSTDRTVGICGGFGAKVIQHQFEGDFGKERNIGADAASGYWILQLDADDVVTPELKNRIEEILRSDFPYVAYKFHRKNFFLGHFMRYGGWYHYYPHLYKRGLARYDGKVHHLLKTDGKIGTLEEAVEHYPFQDFEQFVDRQNRYTSLEAKEILEKEGVLDTKVISYNLKVKPLKLFWKMYIKKMGFREGMHGLVFAILYAWVHFIKWAKYWEEVKARGKIKEI